MSEDQQRFFAWFAANIPRIDPSVACHRLTRNPGARSVAQKKRKMGADRATEVTQKISELLEVDFTREIAYTTWFSNVVLVKKSSGKWQMCVDYTDLNKVCPKDPYPLRTSIISFTILPGISFCHLWKLIQGAYQIKDVLLGKYLAKVKEFMGKFETTSIQHVPKEQNIQAAILSKLASTKSPGNNRYLPNNDLPADQKDRQRFLRYSSRFTMVQGCLYRRGFSTPMLKCLGPYRAQYLLQEIHEGSCDHHPGATSLTKKILQDGYYWLTMDKDASEFTMKWSMDILGPFPLATGQLKFLIVAIDYFTKWIEAEPLSNIMTTNIQKFTWRNIITRFGIPAVVDIDNETQFYDRKFKELLTGLHIKQHFTSFEHPQKNGQAYHTTPHSTIGESPFNLTHGSEAMIPVEIGEPTWRTSHFDEATNSTILRHNLDWIEEKRDRARIRETIVKQRATEKYNRTVVPRDFETNSLVLKRADIEKTKGKLAPNWEGLYRVTSKTSKGAYKLEDLAKKKIPRTRNATNLRQFYA
ncbi:PREDICTED: uncharacterized protein LOC109330824 [Lupinus angustifolius]|uniref:uncharacterized protein LOC109330824 n=1 Tax=Lupinus angustifolius TaxID=3871 RepID=UPI00092FCD85|nr:PREDICTED: uncharacterized protein LOC109330824 [Lupinus angustifolius]